MSRMKSKGQAYSVFKLLIAAVVAVSILMILFSILGGLDFFVTKDPMDEAQKNVKKLVNELGIPKKIGKVTFQPETILAAKPIAEGTQELSSDQVCVQVGPPYDEDARFEVLPRSIRYTGSTTQATGLWIICSRGKEIAQDIEDNGLTDELDPDDCPDFDDESSARFCIVSITEESS
ncbi:MAG: hypothetical protein ABID38_04625 [Candidatus Diapherotrites archaeon]